MVRRKLLCQCLTQQLAGGDMIEVHIKVSVTHFFHQQVTIELQRVMATIPNMFQLMENGILGLIVFRIILPKFSIRLPLVLY